MNEHRTGTGARASDSDPTVSAAYRDLATEKTPPRLDDAVLKSARAAARPRYARAVGWLRPAAWAATIALSLGIVLELTVFSPPPADLGLPPTSAPSEDTSNIDERLDESSTEQPSPVPASPAATAADAVGGSRAEPAAGALRQQAAKREAPPAGDDAAPVISSEALVVPDTRMLEEAEARARLRQDTSSPATAEGVQAFRAGDIAVHAEAADDERSACADESTATPEDWLACIEALEEVGLVDAARRERARLEQAFPDFLPRTEPAQ